MAEALGNNHLYRKVSGVDLFAAEAHYHDFCYHYFFLTMITIRVSWPKMGLTQSKLRRLLLTTQHLL